MPLANNARVIDAPDVIGPRLARHQRHFKGDRPLSTEFTCANGLYFSLRVGRSRECAPKAVKGPWTHVELINPNRSLTVLERYRADPSAHGRTVIYKLVPLETLNQLIARNGGLK